MKVTLSPEDKAFLKRIAEKHGITMEEALRRAIQLNQNLLNAIKQGGKLIIEKKD